MVVPMLQPKRLSVADGLNQQPATQLKAHFKRSVFDSAEFEKIATQLRHYCGKANVHIAKLFTNRDKVQGTVNLLNSRKQLRRPNLYHLPIITQSLTK